MKEQIFHIEKNSNHSKTILLDENSSNNINNNNNKINLNNYSDYDNSKNKISKFCTEKNFSRKKDLNAFFQQNFLSEKKERIPSPNQQEIFNYFNYESNLTKAFQNLIILCNDYDYSLKNEKYWNDNHLNLLKKSDPFIKIKLIQSISDLRTGRSIYYIGKNGIDCCLKNDNENFISIGRQQINDELFRPNNIMLNPTDPSISRSHVKLYYKSFFKEIERYKENIDLILRINKKSKYSFLSKEIFYGIILYLKPKINIKIEDKGTIYGTYVKINQINCKNIIINFYLQIKNLLEKNNFNLFSFSNKYLNELNLFLYNDKILKFKIDKINNLSLFYNEIELCSYLGKLILFENPEKLKIIFQKFINENFNYMLINPFGGDFSNEYLFLKNNLKLNEKDVFLTSEYSGFNIEFIGNLQNAMYYINNNYINNQIEKIFLSYYKIFNNQIIEPNSHMYSCFLNYNNYFENIINFQNDNTIIFVETDGDHCGIMNKKRIIILVHSDCINNEINNKIFSINLQNGFLFGKNKRACVQCNLNIDCDYFIFYNNIVNCWCINNVTNLFNFDKNNQDNLNGLYKCICEDKGGKTRFEKNINYELNNGDQFKFSETIMQIDYKY